MIKNMSISSYSVLTSFYASGEAGMAGCRWMTLPAFLIPHLDLIHHPVSYIVRKEVRA